MLDRTDHKRSIKELEQKFAEVEHRVESVIAENRKMRDRIEALERELAQARKEAQELEHLHGKRLHIREKIEHILQTLEAAGR